MKKHQNIEQVEQKSKQRKVDDDKGGQNDNCRQPENGLDVKPESFDVDVGYEDLPKVDPQPSHQRSLSDVSR